MLMQLIKRLLCSSAIVGAAGAAASFVGGESTIGLQHHHHHHHSTQNQKHHNIRISSPCSSKLKRAHLTTQSSLPMDDPRVESRVMYKIDISLPLGLILEDMDSDPSCGVHIVGISPGGNAAKSNANVFSNIKTLDNTDNTVSDKCICIRDKIISINGNPCHDKSFDDVVELLSSADTSTIVLEIGRLQGSSVVNYDNGLCISAKPGENYGFLARKCNVGIDYDCRSGTCQTCMALLEFPNKRKERSVGRDDEEDGTSNDIIYRRTIFHCVGKVPRNYDWLHVLTGK